MGTDFIDGVVNFTFPSLVLDMVWGEDKNGGLLFDW
jgi:hypothetical protein